MLDVFAKPPTLYYRGQPKITTVAGCACSVIIFLVLFICLMHDLLAYPDLLVSQHVSYIQDSDYSFNPFLAENAQEGLKLSFGIQKSAETSLESFSKYTDIFEPIFYHVDSKTGSNEITHVPLISCKASEDDGYSDYKTGVLLCPDDSAF